MFNRLIGQGITRFFCCCAVILLCAGCVSLIEKGGQVLDGSAFAEKKIAAYSGEGVRVTNVRSRSGETSLIIQIDRFPSIKIRAAAPLEEGNFYLTSLDYLGGSAHGWNEFRLDLSGSGTLRVNGNGAVLAVNDLEPAEISFARIRRYDTYISGSDAMVNLRNRWERVMALAEWMREREDIPRAVSQKQFEALWEPTLFPEMVSKKKRPAAWERNDDVFVKAEDIRWNTGYTRRVFPEELRAIRDSGTMLRDWEEASAWIYNEYNRDVITEALSRTITLWKR